MEKREQSSKNLILVGGVLAVMVVIIALTIYSKKKKGDGGDKGTDTFGETVRSLFYTALVGVIGFIGVKLSRGQTARKIHRKRVLDTEHPTYTDKYLDTSWSTYVNNDVLIAAAGAYWADKFPKDNFVFDTKNFPGILEIYEFLRKEVPEIAQLPSQLTKATFAKITKLEEVLSKHMKSDVMFQVYEKTTKKLKRVDAAFRHSNDQCGDRCIRLVTAGGKVGLLIRATYGYILREDHVDALPSFKLGADNVYKTEQGFTTKDNESSEYITMNDVEKRLLLFLYNIQRKDVQLVVESATNVVRIMYRGSKKLALTFLLDIVDIYFKREKENEYKAATSKSKKLNRLEGEFDEVNDLESILEVAEVYKQRGPIGVEQTVVNSAELYRLLQQEKK